MQSIGACPYTLLAGSREAHFENLAGAFFNEEKKKKKRKQSKGNESLSCLWGSLRETTKIRAGKNQSAEVTPWSQESQKQAANDRLRRRLFLHEHRQPEIRIHGLTCERSFLDKRTIPSVPFLFEAAGKQLWACPTQFVRWIGTNVKRRYNPRTAFDKTHGSSFRALEREAHFRSSKLFSGKRQRVPNLFLKFPKLFTNFHTFSRSGNWKNKFQTFSRLSIPAADLVCIETLCKRVGGTFNQLFLDFFVKFSQKIPLHFFYTMVKKSKMTKTQIKGSCLNYHKATFTLGENV